MSVLTQVGHVKTNLTMFLFCLCVIFSCQVNASLLDPTLIGKELQKFARDALGVDEMQKHFEDLQHHKQTINGEDIIPSLAVRLADKLKTRFAVAKRLKEAVEDSYNRAAKLKPAFPECCKADKSKLKYDARFRSKVDLNNLCLKVSGSAPSNPILLDKNVLLEMKDISRTYPFIKWQYFGSEEGVLTNFPVYDDNEDCSKYDPRYRPFYVETATPEAKDVVLVIDTSASMAGDKLITAREAANTVLDTMNPKDQVGIVSFNHEVSTPGLNGGKSMCYSQRLALAIPENIKCLKKYVGSLVPNGQTKYTLAFEKAFNLFKGTVSEDAGKPKKRVILFLTDGAPDPSDDKKTIFQTIRDMNLELNNSVVILTFGFSSADQKTKDILLDIARQNTEKHGIPANTSVGEITEGRYTQVEDIKTLRSEMANYYNFFASGKVLDRPVVSVPYVDAFGTGLLISITLPCYHKGRFIGVTGTDINIEDLSSEITLFNEGQSAYAYMTSRSGRTIVHPLLPAPTDAYGEPVYLDIRALEPEPEFNDVFESMTTGKSGSKTFLAKRFLPRGGKVNEGVTERHVNSTYVWTQLADTEFTLGVVVPVSYVKETFKTIQLPKDYKFKYHRIDLNSPKKPCSHFGLYAAKDTTVVKFAPGAFEDPYEYIGKDENKAHVELLNAFMTDTKGTIKSPGLKTGIRDTVIATWKVEDLWLREKSELTQYLVWRYIGTADGVFRMMPGAVSDKKYDPRQRPWYYAALANTGFVTLTTPYLDAGGPTGEGAGVVITAARSMYRGEFGHHHHTNDEVLGVMGADFPLTYFYRLLTNMYPKCRDRKTYSCFVMDSAGFLIMHEDFLLYSATAKDVESVHITEKEKNIAEHLIKNNYLKKKECRNLKEIQKQSFYEVHLENEVVDILKSGDSCSKYQLNKIPGTNAYLGVSVRDTVCAAESCTCSFDKECSILSPKCECPCTSPLEFNYCRSQFPNSSLPICPPPAPEMNQQSDPSPPVPRKKCDHPGSALEKCFNPHCSTKNSSQTCDGIVSCYWCVYNKNNVPLKKPYCASSEVCFRGREAEQLNCIKPSKTSLVKDGNWFHRLSTGELAGFIAGVSVVVLSFMVAVFILVIRRCRNTRRPSIDKNTSVSTGNIIDTQNHNLSDRPPAPLPDRPLEYYPDECYEDPDSLERSRASSVASLQWPSPYDEIQVRPSNKLVSIPMQSRRPSNGFANVIPRSPSLPHATDRKMSEPYVMAQTPSPQETNVSERNTFTSTDNLPHFSARRAMSGEVQQPPVPKPRKSSDGYPSQNHVRKLSPGHPPHPALRKISVTDPPPLSKLTNMSAHNPLQLSNVHATVSAPAFVISGEQDTSTSNNPLYATETIDHRSSTAGAEGVNRPTYSNLPPPLPAPRKNNDGYMTPLTLQTRDQLTLRPNDSLASTDSNGYLKCYV